MRRSRAQPMEMAGQDSFLDIVANIVGILIILVMVVGVRAGSAPVEAPPAAIASQPRELTGLASENSSLEYDVHRLHQQSSRVKQEIARRSHERDQLATYVAAVREELDKRRAALDGESRQQYDLRREFDQARSELDRIRREAQAARAVQPETVMIQSLPTPLSKTVHGKEAHFQLRAGHLAFIPLEPLLEEFRATARHKVWKLKDRAQMTETVGPIGGFRLRYELGRFDVPFEAQVETGRGGSVVELVEWELLPVSAQLGEPVETALAPRSQFRTVLDTLDPRATTITIWTYPDSFAEFRRLKAELHALGYPTASRPLPEGQSIGGSPEGTRSAAQ